MPETDQERLNRIGNLIYLAVVFLVAVCGLTWFLIAAFGTS